MVKAIVFDLGGVLIDLDFDRSVRAFREIRGMTPGEYRQLVGKI